MSNEYIKADEHGVKFHDDSPIYSAGYGERFDLKACPGSYIGIIGSTGDYFDVTLPIESLWELQSIQIDSFRGYITTPDGKVVDQFNLAPVNMKSWYPVTNVINGVGASMQIRVPARIVNSNKFKAYTKGTASFKYLTAGDTVFLHVTEFKFHNIF